MSKRIFKRLTLAQCVDVQCRPTVEGCHPLHSAYLHTPFMCIVPWQSGAYALTWSALYAYFKLSAPKTMRLLSGHILPRNASNFTCSHLDLKNFPGVRNPRISAYMDGE